MFKKWDLIIFLFGGVTYGMVEIMWRNHTHYTMVILGGLCFLVLYRLFTAMNNYSLLEKCVAGAIIITFLEFLTGCIVNLLLNMGVWNYSKVPFNLLGQVCVLYSVLWGLICIPVAYLSKLIKRYEKRRG